MTIDSPGARFRAAVKEEHPLQCIGAINAYHARLAEASGFKSLYISGGGVAGVLAAYLILVSQRLKMY